MERHAASPLQKVPGIRPELPKSSVPFKYPGRRWDFCLPKLSKTSRNILRLLRCYPGLREPRKYPESPGQPRRALEMPGEHRRALESPGELRRAAESFSKHRKAEESNPRHAGVSPQEKVSERTPERSVELRKAATTPGQMELRFAEAQRAKASKSKQNQAKASKRMQKQTQASTSKHKQAKANKSKQKQAKANRSKQKQEKASKSKQRQTKQSQANKIKAK